MSPSQYWRIVTGPTQWTAARYRILLVSLYFRVSSATITPPTLTCPRNAAARCHRLPHRDLLVRALLAAEQRLCGVVRPVEAHAEHGIADDQFGGRAGAPVRR